MVGVGLPPVTPRALVTPITGDSRWVWERCWRDFFSLRCCDLVGNKLTPCAQAVSVVPVLVLGAGSLPILLSIPVPLLSQSEKYKQY